MPIKLIRIDDRYIHGQVTVGWVNAYGINEIWVVDDTIASNPILKQLQIALAPPNTKVEVLKVSEAIEKIRNRDFDEKSNIMIIVAKATTCLKLIKESNLRIDWVNVGQSAWKEGKVLVVKSFAVDMDDVKAFEEMVKMGIRLVYQMLPSEKAQDFYELLRSKGLVKD